MFYTSLSRSSTSWLSAGGWIAVKRPRIGGILLKMLSAHLEQLPGAYFTWLVFASLAQYDQTDEGRSQAVEFRDKNSERLGTIRDFISKNRFDFSLTLQEHLEKLERAMGLSVEEVSILDRRVVDQAMERMQRPYLSLRAVVRTEMQK